MEATKLADEGWEKQRFSLDLDLVRHYNLASLLWLVRVAVQLRHEHGQ